MMVWMCVLIGIVALVAIECLRETHTFRITSYQVQSPKLNGTKKRKIILLSDLHNCSYGVNNEKLLRAIQKEKPDLILIAGDMLVGSKKKSPKVAEDFVTQLPQICNTYYANGNHEHRLKDKEEKPGTSYKAYKEKLVNAGVHYLENEKVTFVWEGRQVTVTGLEIPRDTYTKFKKLQLPKNCLTELVGHAKADDYEILIAHNPAFMDEYLKWGADLIVSGHLHGGIVRIPFWRGIITPQGDLFPKYSGEMTKVGNQTVVVSKGIGIHTIKLRFLNPAEVVVLHVGGLEE